MVDINFQVVLVQHVHQFMWVRKQNEDSNGRPPQIFLKTDSVIAL